MTFEDIAFFNRVDILRRQECGGATGLGGGVLLEHGNLAGGQSPCGRGRRGDIPLPFHRALEAGLDRLREDREKDGRQ